MANTTLRTRNTIIDGAFLLPALLLLVVFRLLPGMFTAIASFTKWPVIGSPEFIGLANFRTLIEDTHFHQALFNTLHYSAMLIPVLVAGSLALALFIVSFVRAQAALKMIHYLPMVIPLSITAVIWKVGIYSPFGAVNQILSELGMQQIQFLRADYARQSIALTMVWRQLGFWALMYIAGLSGIPRSFYESAVVDGATYVQRFFFITWPLLKPVTLLVTILTTIASFRVFGIVYAMTGGGPSGATKTLLYYSYELGWQDFRMGYGSTVAFVFLLIVLALNAVQRWLIGDSNDL